MVTEKYRHFLPAWMLRKFKTPLLYELDIFTGKTEPRNPEKGGGEYDAWDQPTEDMLSVHDDAASRVWRTHLAPLLKDRPKEMFLAEKERENLVKFLAWFLVRGPRAFDRLEPIRLEMTARHVQEMRLELLSNPDKTLAMVKAQYPLEYRQKIDQWGVQAGERALIQFGVLSAIRHFKARMGDTRQVRQDYMQIADIPRMSKVLRDRFRWEWLVAEHGFVIGTILWPFGASRKTPSPLASIIPTAK